MTTETQAAFARRLGVNRSTVNRHITAGRVVTRGKLIDVEASLAKLAATTGTRPDVAARHAAERGAAIPNLVEQEKNAQKPENHAAADIGLPEDGPTGSKARYKATALHYENAAIKLEIALRRGIRHPLPAVKREAVALGGTLRSALERLIDQTAPRLAVMTSQTDRAALIGTQASALRRLIRSELPHALRRLRKTGEKP